MGSDPQYCDITSLDDDVNCTINKYWYLYGNCGYYYKIIFQKENDTTDYFTIITGGILFDRLENKRINNITTKLTFKMEMIQIDSSLNIRHIMIDGFNSDGTTLVDAV